MLKEEVPLNDLICPPVLFVADNGKRGTIYVWKRAYREQGILVETFYWYALGNSGEEESVPDATAAARNWIRNGMRVQTK